MRLAATNDGELAGKAVECSDMTVLTASLLVDCRCKLGEGIQWNSAKDRLYWTDIFGDTLYSCDMAGGSVEAFALPGGLCAFAFSDRGPMLAAFTDGLYWLDWKKGHRELVQAYQPEQPTTRMNDGMLDRQGRFVVGGMDENGMAATTAVWSVTSMGVQGLFAGVGCSNSTAFSPDGGTMYFADSARHEIVAFDYDTETGNPSNKRHFAEMDHAFGKPDGSCVDTEGGLWNARFGGSCVQRFRTDGTPDFRVSVAVPNVTSCCFGGAGLNRLFITTAAMGMSEEQSVAAPTAGGIFAIDLPIQGLEHGTFNEESNGR